MALPEEDEVGPRAPPRVASSSSLWSAPTLLRASYKDLGSPAAVQDCFLQHLLSACRTSLYRLLAQTSTTTKDYSMELDAFSFIQAEPVLGHLLLRYPATLLPLLEAAVVKAQQQCLSDLQSSQQLSQHDNNINHDTDGWTVKGATTGTRVHARLVNLPPAQHNQTLSEWLVAAHVGRMVPVQGTVVRTGPVLLYEAARTYACAECKHRRVVAADVEDRHNALRPPTTPCPSCQSTKMPKVVPDASIHTDYQELKIQETSSSTSANQHSSGGSSIGQIPRSLLVKVQHDLVDSCQPGDQVVVVGSLLAQWPAGAQAQLPDAECPVDMAMMAHSVRVVDEGPTPTADASDLEQYQREFTSYWADAHSSLKLIQARDFICQAVCPKLYGMASIKLALLITLIGGVPADAYLVSSQEETFTTDEAASSFASPLPDPRNNDQPDPFVLPTSRTPSRSDVAAAAWNSASTPQSSSSSPPLSSHKRARRRIVQTRRRDQSHLLLVGDPGLGKSQFLKFAAAVSPRSVLTTGVGTTSAGLTCAAVREGSSKEFSLEAGALVLADKGVCCIDEFGCIQDQDRTTIHEAMEQQTLSVAKAGIVCKLNCRATVIAVMNPRGCVYDNHKSLSGNTGLGTPLLSRFDLIFKLVDTADAERDNNVTMYLLNRAIQGAGLDVPTEKGTNGNAQKHSTNQPWSLEKLRAYIAIVKERFQPVMSDAAARLLESHYEHCRSCQSTTIPVTVRFLESLIRLSQAHARLMFRNHVTIQDAVAVIQLMQCSAFAYGGFDGGVGGGGNTSMMGSQLMYCDPMTVDFPDEADADFALFEYQLLSHYNMLEYMPAERRELASQFMAVGVNNPVATSWDQCEDIREKRF